MAWQRRDRTSKVSDQPVAAPGTQQRNSPCSVIERASVRLHFAQHPLPGTCRRSGSGARSAHRRAMLSPTQSAAHADAPPLGSRPTWTERRVDTLAITSSPSSCTGTCSALPVAAAASANPWDSERSRPQEPSRTVAGISSSVVKGDDTLRSIHLSNDECTGYPRAGPEIPCRKNRYSASVRSAAPVVARP
jgi:hypothetical protein